MATVADAWRPTSELERRLHETVRSGDQEGYFRLLAQSELVIPVPPDRIDDVLADRDKPTWPVQEEDGRTHVLAYTSAAAMRECLGPAYRHFLRLRFTDLAQTWPDARWWLAVDVPARGADEVVLPIEARMPAWFIKQVVEGDTGLPKAGRDTPTSLPSSTPVPPPPAPTPVADAPAPDGAIVQETPAPSPAVADAPPLDATAPQAPAPEAPASQAPAAETHAPDSPVPEPSPLPEGGMAPGLSEETAAPQPDAADVTRLDNPVVPDVPPAGAEPAADAEARDDQAQWEELQGQHRELPREEQRRSEFQPANDVERDLFRAATTNDHDLFLQSLADAEVLLPVPEDLDYLSRPGRPGFPWSTREVDGTSVIPVFTSRERLVEAARSAGTGTDSLALPFTVVLRYWPDRSRPLAVNPGSPAGGTILAEQLSGLATWADQRAARRMSEGFEPQNDVERRLFDAALRRDTDGFFKVLLGAQVLVPADPETPWGIAPDDPAFPWRPVPVHGAVSIQVFTSLKWMNEAIGSSRFVMPTLLEIVNAWPDTEWTLILNPGTPIDATLPGERVRALSGPSHSGTGDSAPAAPAPEPPARPVETGPPAEPEPVHAGEPETIPSAAPASAPPAPAASADEAADTRPSPPETEFEPGNRIDQELYEAALAGDSDAFLRVLLGANVLVPIPADAPLEVTPIQREFRWEAALRGPSAVQVFTSLVRLQEVLPESRFVYADFRELIGAWPDPEWDMLLNPGTRIGASLRGDQVRALSEWAVRVGLVQPRPEVPTPPPSQQQPDATVADLPPVPAAEPATAQDVVAAPSPGGPHAAQAEEPAPARAPVPAPDPEAERSPQPTIMQKVVPHHHVEWYLQQGYDRVGGFVHPTSDVAELQTPLQLYETLGLLYDDSPFRPDDQGVHVIRWPAYCPDLYRIPFGGQTEEELAAWGDAGWVVERPPFLGGGFAPGSAGSIREYKVDSVRLPYGAEMYHLGADGSERFVAMYDPDRLAWLRPQNDTASQPDGWDGQGQGAAR
ncbi:hypothetical protein Acsp03_70570 [Actinomadura sp. NBRC 104412]|uniref:SseB family protein n=1 Tax=Actinomadura sp. NBRC 104412 TaxID=3032203 RepID=UPI0024A1064F|nr:SseB family protein [Actinomadura sp. NBRC 104412]GLZ09591.1 hypothetical protein Acsp03_70570 [Actinomadura sp. NBRC 104412]